MRANPQVINHQRTCIDCPEMWCKEFYHKTELWTGYCHLLRRKVNGNDLCHLPRQPPKELATQLEIDFNK